MEKLIAEDLWTVNLRKDSQRITSVAAKRSAEHVHSQGVVLGDRNVLYKYINPNLVAVVAEGDDGQDKRECGFIIFKLLIKNRHQLVMLIIRIHV